MKMLLKQLEVVLTIAILIGIGMFCLKARNGQVTLPTQAVAALQSHQADGAAAPEGFSDTQARAQVAAMEILNSQNGVKLVEDMRDSGRIPGLIRN